MQLNAILSEILCMQKVILGNTGRLINTKTLMLILKEGDIECKMILLKQKFSHKNSLL